MILDIITILINIMTYDISSFIKKLCYFVENSKIKNIRKIPFSKD